MNLVIKRGEIRRLYFHWFKQIGKVIVLFVSIIK